MDYDVAVLGLHTPPAQAVVTSYRPAVQVRNNGIHNAIASGYLRIYSAGLLIFETEVYSGTIVPGATSTADAVDYWTPEHEGSYVVNGYVTTPLDQVEPNNNLNPTTIIVSGGPVPPPPTVPLHAAQHEEGGTDPINVDGLPGVLTDRQLPSAHAAQHQAGQTDVLNVSGLAGILGDPQSPIVHGNAHHNPAMTTADELVAHANASSAHTAAINLANRDLSGALTGLVPSAQLANLTEYPAHTRQALLSGRGWGYPKQAALGSNLSPVDVTPSSGLLTIGQLTIPVEWISDEMQFLLGFTSLLGSTGNPNATLTLSLWFGPVVLSAITIDCSTLRTILMSTSGSVLGRPTSKVVGTLTSSCQIQSATPTPLILCDPSEILGSVPSGAGSILMKAEFDNAVPGDTLAIKTGYIRAIHPIP